jgi:acyl-CoA synthetase (AMP-forming)/AMP-acid ligase II
MIKTGGENVYPAEVEAVLLAMPQIAEAAVVGLADPRLGQRVAAVIVPRTAGLVEADVDRWCRQQLAGFKLPRTVLFVDHIEKLGSFKINYTAVKALLIDSV